MAVTSRWEWESINRGIDTNVFAGIVRTRNNWSLTRKRVSDEAYASELGDTATMLNGFNGGVTETIVSPEVVSVGFGSISGGGGVTDVIVAGAADTTINGIYEFNGYDGYGDPTWRLDGSTWLQYDGSRWSLSGVYYSNPCSNGVMPYDAVWSGSGAPTSVSSAGLPANWAVEGDVWVETGFQRGGFPVYILLGENHPLEYRRNTLWLSTEGATVAWCMSAFEQSEIEGNSFEDNYANLSNDYAISSTVGYHPIDGIVFSGHVSGIYSGTSATASLGSTQIPLLCTADNQSYPSKNVDWFTQTQNWTYVDSWV